MLGDDHPASLAHDAANGGEDEGGAVGVELRGRLVQDHERRVHGERRRQRDTLALASAQRSHEAAG